MSKRHVSTYSDYHYRLTRNKIERNKETFENELPVLLKKYKLDKDRDTFCKILLLIDPLIIRMIMQLKEKWSYLKFHEMDELYNIAVVVLHDSCMKFEIKDAMSIYSFPIYLKTYISREFKKVLFRGDKETISLDSSDAIEEYFRIVKDESEVDKHLINNIVNDLIYKGILTSQYACILKLRLQGKPSNDIAKRMHISVSRVSFLFKKTVLILKEWFMNDGFNKRREDGIEIKY